MEKKTGSAKTAGLLLNLVVYAGAFGAGLIPMPPRKKTGKAM